MQEDDSPGHTIVIFTDGDPIVGFEGNRIGGDGPLFFSDFVYLPDGPPLHLSPGSGQGCHFYLTDHGTLTPGWEKYLTLIECDFRSKHIRFTPN